MLFGLVHNSKTYFNSILIIKNYFKIDLYWNGSGLKALFAQSDKIVFRDLFANKRHLSIFIKANKRGRLECAISKNIGSHKATLHSRVCQFKYKNWWLACSSGRNVTVNYSMEKWYNGLAIFLRHSHGSPDLGSTSGALVWTNIQTV